MEVYVDDILVKILDIHQYICDLKDIFSTLRKYNMKLNPKKCTFKVEARKFLGFLISQIGIEANLEKIKVVLEMHPPNSIKNI